MPAAGRLSGERHGTTAGCGGDGCGRCVEIKERVAFRDLHEALQVLGVGHIADMAAEASGLGGALLGIDGPGDPAPVQAAWQAIARGHDAQQRPLVMVMFVSPSAVQRFFAGRPSGLAGVRGRAGPPAGLHQ